MKILEKILIVILIVVGLANIIGAIDYFLSNKPSDATWSLIGTILCLGVAFILYKLREK